MEHYLLQAGRKNGKARWVWVGQRRLTNLEQPCSGINLTSIDSSHREQSIDVSYNAKQAKIGEKYQNETD